MELTRCVGVCALLLAFGCKKDDAEARAEARDLLTLLNAIEDNTSLELRKKQLDALQFLEVKNTENRAARDACHAAHFGLWQAEFEQAKAKLAIDAAEKQPKPQGGPVAPSTAHGEQAAQAIELSNQALDQAQKHFPACEKAMESLIVRGR